MLTLCLYAFKLLLYTTGISFKWHWNLAPGRVIEHASLWLRA
jgi:hypothetical protein